MKSPHHLGTCCEAAIELVPTADNHHVALADNLVEQAAITKSPAERNRQFSRALRAVETARKLRPLNANYVGGCADVYRRSAEAEPEGETKVTLARKAIQSYQEAAVLDPKVSDWWYRMAYVEIGLLRSVDEALPWLRRSLVLCPVSHRTYALLGNAFFLKGGGSDTCPDREVFFSRAITNYQAALNLAGTNRASFVYLYTVALGKSFIQLRRYSEAIDAYQSALTLSPQSERWKNEEALARLFRDKKDKSNSMEHLRRAIELAPPEKHSDLIALQNAILSAP